MSVTDDACESWSLLTQPMFTALLTKAASMKPAQSSVLEFSLMGSIPASWRWLFGETWHLGLDQIGPMWARYRSWHACGRPNEGCGSVCVCVRVSEREHKRGIQFMHTAFDQCLNLRLWGMFLFLLWRQSEFFVIVLVQLGPDCVCVCVFSSG